MAEEQQTKFQGLFTELINSQNIIVKFFPVSKKLREPYQIWVPEAKDILALENSVPIPCQGEPVLRP